MADHHTSDAPADPQPFAVEVHRDADATVISVQGEVDLYTAPQLEARLDAIAAEPGLELVVDLGRLDFIDSTGLGVLVGALKRVRERGGDMRLRNANRSTFKILEIGGLTKLFTVE